jgi:hypothetical protein
MVGGKLPAFDDDVWELYDGTDYSQARNLVAERPEMLAKLQRLWLIEATKYNVLPMDDRTSERLEPSMAGRPTLIRGAPSCSSPAWDVCRRAASSASKTSRSLFPPRWSYRTTARRA